MGPAYVFDPSHAPLPIPSFCSARTALRYLASSAARVRFQRAMAVRVVRAAGMGGRVASRDAPASSTGLKMRGSLVRCSL
jgi:hypothetical protein